eukprot:TRINITY_DN29392_c0_g1_i2.p2 TRINITY_DN29392_c0_g1~~TRINITY_DN29392_c0_g1_i2.p2  ORF type:complete len:163 (-),score=30.87 TRINITY_DN29392_c0_g1_i2:260-748(-)
MEIGGTGSGPSDTVVDIQDKITTPLISKVSLENESSHSQQAHNLIDDLSPIHTEGDFEESRVHLNRGQGGIASNPELLPSNKRSIQRQRSRRRSHMGFPGTGTFVYSKLRRSMDVAPIPPRSITGGGDNDVLQKLLKLSRDPNEGQVQQQQQATRGARIVQG